MLWGRASVFWGGGLHHFAAGVCAALGVTGPLPLWGKGLRRFGEIWASDALGKGPLALLRHLGLRRSEARGLCCFWDPGASAALWQGPPPLW